MTKTTKAKATKAKTPVVTEEGLTVITPHKTKEELNKDVLTLDSKADVKVITHYRKGCSPILLPNKDIEYYTISVNGVSIIVSQTQYDALLGIKAEDIEGTDND